MGCYGQFIMGPYFQVDAYHPALVDFATGFQNGEHGSGKNERSTPGDSGLDDQVRLHEPDNLLHGLEILGNLQNGDAQPREVVDIVGLADAYLVEERPGSRLQFLVATIGGNSAVHLLSILFEGSHVCHLYWLEEC